jgi:hypothetical protein
MKMFCDVSWPGYGQVSREMVGTIFSYVRLCR